MTRVLIADDHPLMLSGIESMLRGTDYEVVAKARDGAEALEAFAKARPDIMILDSKMPRLTGIEVLRTLRGRGDNVPVVLLTADLDDHALMDAVKLQANGIILKDGAETLILDCLDQVRRGEKWIGRPMLQRALDTALAGGPGAKSGFASLTPRERTIARLVSEGMRNKEIGQEVGLSEGTIKIYLHRLYEKLGIQNRVELAMLSRNESFQSR